MNFYYCTNPVTLDVIEEARAIKGRRNLLIFRTGYIQLQSSRQDNDRSFGQLGTIIRDVCPLSRWTVILDVTPESSTQEFILVLSNAKSTICGIVAVVPTLFPEVSNGFSWTCIFVIV